CYNGRNGRENEHTFLNSVDGSVNSCCPTFPRVTSLVRSAASKFQKLTRIERRLYTAISLVVAACFLAEPFVRSTYGKAPARQLIISSVVFGFAIGMCVLLGYRKAKLR